MQFELLDRLPLRHPQDSPIFEISSILFWRALFSFREVFNVLILLQGFSSYDGAINVPGNSGSAEQITDSSAAATVFIEKAAAQVRTSTHMRACTDALLAEILCHLMRSLWLILSSVAKTNSFLEFNF